MIDPNIGIVLIFSINSTLRGVQNYQSGMLFFIGKSTFSSKFLVMSFNRTKDGPITETMINMTECKCVIEFFWKAHKLTLSHRRAIIFYFHFRDSPLVNVLALVLNVCLLLSARPRPLLFEFLIDAQSSVPERTERGSVAYRITLVWESREKACWRDCFPVEGRICQR